MPEDGHTQTILRLDGTVVVIRAKPNGCYELVVEHPHGKSRRLVPREVALDPLNTPEFDTIVDRLKAELPRERKRRGAGSK